MGNARIVVFEDGADLLRDVVTREREPVELDVWRGCGPERGTWEDAHPVFAVYIPPRAA